MKFPIFPIISGLAQAPVCIIGSGLAAMVSTTRSNLMSSTWIPRRRHERIMASQARLRLFCFPYAGGGASVFRQWWDEIPSSVDFCPIQLPGRERRIGEPLIKNLAEMLDLLEQGLAGEFSPPYAIFGHSMGALIAFELARRLQSRGNPPAHLLVSGRGAPQLPRRHPLKHDLPEEEFLEHLQRPDSGNEQVFQHTELRELFVPILRADYQLIETHSHADGARLDCPISAYGGAVDEDVPLSSLQAWAEQTNASFRAKLFPGGHFYLREQQAALIHEILRDVDHILPEV